MPEALAIKSGQNPNVELAYCLEEPGADEVESRLAQGPNIVASTSNSWVALDTRLHELVSEREEQEGRENVLF